MPKAAATAPVSPISRWPIRTAKLTMLAPGMILANANAAANSGSVIQARRSTNALCIHPDVPAETRKADGREEHEQSGHAAGRPRRGGFKGSFHFNAITLARRRSQNHRMSFTRMKHNVFRRAGGVYIACCRPIGLSLGRYPGNVPQ